MQNHDHDRTHDAAVRTAARVHPEARDADGAVTGALGQLLADSYRLALKTQNFHWNVTGPQFSALHELFEQQYRELAEAIDTIAERLRALGVRSPGSFAEFRRLSTVGDAHGEPDAFEMCRTLADDHRLVSETAARVVRAATEIGDEGTADLAVGRIRVSDKASWILISHVG